MCTEVVVSLWTGVVSRSEFDAAAIKIKRKVLTLEILLAELPHNMEQFRNKVKVR